MLIHQNVLSEKQQMIEQKIIAMVCYNPEIVKDPNLTVELFGIKAYASILQVCKEVYEEKGKVKEEDIIPVLSKLGLDNLFYELLDSGYEQSRYEEYLAELQQFYTIRQIRSALEDVEKEIVTVDEFKSYVYQIGKEFDLGTATKWSIDKIVHELKTQEEALKFHHLSFYRDIVKPSKRTVNVIGARTGVGKSAFSLNVVNDLAETYMCLYFNLEMTEKEIYQRLMAMQSNVPINHFPHMTDKELNALSDAAYRFENSLKFKLYNGSKSIGGIEKIVARESRKEHCILFVDHIGYVTNKKISNTRERIQNTMIELNRLTKDYDCTVFALSQLNRDTDDVPKLINLKDSGEVEQTAHSIVLLHNKTNDYSEAIANYELICAKNRGMTGIKDMYFNKRTQKFYE